MSFSNPLNFAVHCFAMSNRPIIMRLDANAVTQGERTLAEAGDRGQLSNDCVCHLWEASIISKDS